MIVTIGKSNRKSDIKDLTKKRKAVNLPKSTKEFEKLIGQAEYSTKKYLDRSKLTDKELMAVDAYENITSFGIDVADCFEDLLEELGRIPTQDEYVNRGVELTSMWCEAILKHDNRVLGINFEGAVVDACKDRLGRGYISMVNELHTKLLLKEIYPKAKVISHDLLDLLLGVDIVLELDKKRYYIHIFKDSHYGVQAFYNKEQRGGINKDGKFIKYQRDFTGDVRLQYLSRDTNSDKCKFINGMPVFTREWLEGYLFMVTRSSKFGERLDAEDSKLDKLKAFVFDNFGQRVEFK